MKEWMNVALKANGEVKKSTARLLVLTAILLLVLLPLACGFLGSRPAHGQEMNIMGVDVEQMLLTSAIMTGVPGPGLGIVAQDGDKVEEPDKPWTLETYYANRSAFKAFGSVASDDPIMGTSLTYVDEKWDAFLLIVEPIGTHEAGVIADFGDLIVQRKFDVAGLDAKAGVEVFYGPGYRGGQSSMFVAPLASVSKSLSHGWSFEMGAQYVGTYKTLYGDGDRLFGYTEFAYSYTRGPWTFSSLFGAIASDKGRTSAYIRPRVALATPWALLKLSLLREESDGQNGKFSIPATPTITASWTF